MAKFTKFVKHRAVDSSDPGFTLPGFKLRWVSARVSEDRSGRSWAVLRKNDLPVELLKQIEDVNPNAFQKGDTIRRGDLVLAYTTDEMNQITKKHLAEKAKEVASQVKSAPSVKGPDGRNRASVEKNEDTDVTQEMIERFKSSNKQND